MRYVYLVHMSQDDKNVLLRLVSDKRHHSVISLLRNKDQFRMYRNWDLVGWACKENTKTGKLIDGAVQCLPSGLAV